MKRIQKDNKAEKILKQLNAISPGVGKITIPGINESNQKRKAVNKEEATWKGLSGALERVSSLLSKSDSEKTADEIFREGARLVPQRLRRYIDANWYPAAVEDELWVATCAVYIALSRKPERAIIFRDVIAPVFSKYPEWMKPNTTRRYLIELVKDREAAEEWAASELERIAKSLKKRENQPVRVKPDFIAAQLSEMSWFAELKLDKETRYTIAEIVAELTRRTNLRDTGERNSGFLDSENNLMPGKVKDALRGRLFALRLTEEQRGVLLTQLPVLIGASGWTPLNAGTTKSSDAFRLYGPFDIEGDNFFDRQDMGIPQRKGIAFIDKNAPSTKSGSNAISAEPSQETAEVAPAKAGRSTEELAAQLNQRQSENPEEEKSSFLSFVEAKIGATDRDKGTYRNYIDQKWVDLPKLGDPKRALADELLLDMILWLVDKQVFSEEQILVLSNARFIEEFLGPEKKEMFMDWAETAKREDYPLDIGDWEFKLSPGDIDRIRNLPEKELDAVKEMIDAARAKNKTKTTPSNGAINFYSPYNPDDEIGQFYARAGSGEREIERKRSPIFNLSGLPQNGQVYIKDVFLPAAEKQGLSAEQIDSMLSFAKEISDSLLEIKTAGTEAEKRAAEDNLRDEIPEESWPLLQRMVNLDHFLDEKSIAHGDVESMVLKFSISSYVLSKQNKPGADGRAILSKEEFLANIIKNCEPEHYDQLLNKLRGWETNGFQIEHLTGLGMGGVLIDVVRAAHYIAITALFGATGYVMLQSANEPVEYALIAAVAGLLMARMTDDYEPKESEPAGEKTAEWIFKDGLRIVPYRFKAYFVPRLVRGVGDHTLLYSEKINETLTSNKDAATRFRDIIAPTLAAHPKGMVPLNRFYGPLRPDDLYDLLLNEEEASNWRAFSLKRIAKETSAKDKPAKDADPQTETTLGLDDKATLLPDRLGGVVRSVKDSFSGIFEVKRPSERRIKLFLRELGTFSSSDTRKAREFLVELIEYLEGLKAEDHSLYSSLMKLLNDGLSLFFASEAGSGFLRANLLCIVDTIPVTEEKLRKDFVDFIKEYIPPEKIEAENIESIVLVDTLRSEDIDDFVRILGSSTQTKNFLIELKNYLEGVKNENPDLHGFIKLITRAIRMYNRDPSPYRFAPICASIVVIKKYLSPNLQDKVNWFIEDNELKLRLDKETAANSSNKLENTQTKTTEGINQIKQKISETSSSTVEGGKNAPVEVKSVSIDSVYDVLERIGLRHSVSIDSAKDKVFIEEVTRRLLEAEGEGMRTTSGIAAKLEGIIVPENLNELFSDDYVHYKKQVLPEFLALVAGASASLRAVNRDVIVLTCTVQELNELKYFLDSIHYFLHVPYTSTGEDTCETSLLLQRVFDAIREKLKSNSPNIIGPHLKGVPIASHPVYVKYFKPFEKQFGFKSKSDETNKTETGLGMGTDALRLHGPFDIEGENFFDKQYMGIPPRKGISFIDENAPSTKSGSDAMGSEGLKDASVGFAPFKRLKLRRITKKHPRASEALLRNYSKTVGKFNLGYFGDMTFSVVPVTLMLIDEFGEDVFLRFLEKDEKNHFLGYYELMYGLIRRERKRKNYARESMRMLFGLFDGESRPAVAEVLVEMPRELKDPILTMSPSKKGRAEHSDFIARRNELFDNGEYLRLFKKNPSHAVGLLMGLTSEDKYFAGLKAIKEEYGVGSLGDYLSVNIGAGVYPVFEAAAVDAAQFDVMFYLGAVDKSAYSVVSQAAERKDILEYLSENRRTIADWLGAQADRKWFDMIVRGLLKVEVGDLKSLDKSFLISLLREKEAARNFAENPSEYLAGYMSAVSQSLKSVITANLRKKFGEIKEITATSQETEGLCSWAAEIVTYVSRIAVNEAAKQEKGELGLLVAQAVTELGVPNEIADIYKANEAKIKETIALVAQGGLLTKQQTETKTEKEVNAEDADKQLSDKGQKDAAAEGFDELMSSLKENNPSAREIFDRIGLDKLKTVFIAAPNSFFKFMDSLLDFIGKTGAEPGSGNAVNPPAEYLADWLSGMDAARIEAFIRGEGLSDILAEKGDYEHMLSDPLTYFYDRGTLTLRIRAIIQENRHKEKTPLLDDLTASLVAEVIFNYLFTFLSFKREETLSRGGLSEESVVAIIKQNRGVLNYLAEKRRLSIRKQFVFRKLKEEFVKTTSVDLYGLRAGLSKYTCPSGYITGSYSDELITREIFYESLWIKLFNYDMKDIPRATSILKELGIAHVWFDNYILELEPNNPFFNDSKPMLIIPFKEDIEKFLETKEQWFEYYPRNAWMRLKGEYVSIEEVEAFFNDAKDKLPARNPHLRHTGEQGSGFSEDAQKNSIDIKPGMGVFGSQPAQMLGGRTESGRDADTAFELFRMSFGDADLALLFHLDRVLSGAGIQGFKLRKQGWDRYIEITDYKSFRKTSDENFESIKDLVYRVDEADRPEKLEKKGLPSIIHDGGRYFFKDVKPHTTLFFEHVMEDVRKWLVGKGVDSEEFREGDMSLIAGKILEYNRELNKRSTEAKAVEGVLVSEIDGLSSGLLSALAKKGITRINPEIGIGGSLTHHPNALGERGAVNLKPVVDAARKAGKISKQTEIQNTVPSLNRLGWKTARPKNNAVQREHATPKNGRVLLSDLAAGLDALEASVKAVKKKTPSKAKACNSILSGIKSLKADVAAGRKNTPKSRKYYVNLLNEVRNLRDSVTGESQKSARSPVFKDVLKQTKTLASKVENAVAPARTPAGTKKESVGKKESFDREALLEEYRENAELFPGDFVSAGDYVLQKAFGVSNYITSAEIYALLKSLDRKTRKEVEAVLDSSWVISLEDKKELHRLEYDALGLGIGGDVRRILYYDKNDELEKVAVFHPSDKRTMGILLTEESFYRSENIDRLRVEVTDSKIEEEIRARGWILAVDEEGRKWTLYSDTQKDLLELPAIKSVEKPELKETPEHKEQIGKWKNPEMLTPQNDFLEALGWLEAVRRAAEGVTNLRPLYSYLTTLKEVSEEVYHYGEVWMEQPVLRLNGDTLFISTPVGEYTARRIDGETSVRLITEARGTETNSINRNEIPALNSRTGISPEIIQDSKELSIDLRKRCDALIEEAKVLSSGSRFAEAADKIGEAAYLLETSGTEDLKREYDHLRIGQAFLLIHAIKQTGTVSLRFEAKKLLGILSLENKKRLNYREDQNDVYANTILSIDADRLNEALYRLHVIAGDWNTPPIGEIELQETFEEVNAEDKPFEQKAKEQPKKPKYLETGFLLSLRDARECEELAARLVRDGFGKVTLEKKTATAIISAKNAERFLEIVEENPRTYEKYLRRLNETEKGMVEQAGGPLIRIGDAWYTIPMKPQMLEIGASGTEKNAELVLLSSRLKDLKQRKSRLSVCLGEYLDYADEEGDISEVPDSLKSDAIRLRKIEKEIAGTEKRITELGGSLIFGPRGFAMEYNSVEPDTPLSEEMKYARAKALQEKVNPFDRETAEARNGVAGGLRPSGSVPPELYARTIVEDDNDMAAAIEGFEYMVPQDERVWPDYFTKVRLVMGRITREGEVLWSRYVEKMAGKGVDTSLFGFKPLVFSDEAKNEETLKKIFSRYGLDNCSIRRASSHLDAQRVARSLNRLLSLAHISERTTSSEEGLPFPVLKCSRALRKDLKIETRDWRGDREYSVKWRDATIVSTSQRDYFSEGAPIAFYVVENGGHSDVIQVIMVTEEASYFLYFDSLDEKFFVGLGPTLLDMGMAAEPSEEDSTAKNTAQEIRKDEKRGPAGGLRPSGYLPPELYARNILGDNNDMAAAIEGFEYMVPQDERVWPDYFAKVRLIMGSLTPEGERMWSRYVEKMAGKGVDTSLFGFKPLVFSDEAKNEETLKKIFSKHMLDIGSIRRASSQLDARRVAHSLRKLQYLAYLSEHETSVLYYIPELEKIVPLLRNDLRIETGGGREDNSVYSVKWRDATIVSTCPRDYFAKGAPIAFYVAEEGIPEGVIMVTEEASYLLYRDFEDRFCVRSGPTLLNMGMEADPSEEDSTAKNTAQEIETPSNQRTMHRDDFDPNNPFDRETAEIRRGVSSVTNYGNWSVPVKNCLRILYRNGSVPVEFLAFRLYNRREEVTTAVSSKLLFDDQDAFVLGNTFFDSLSKLTDADADKMTVDMVLSILGAGTEAIEEFNQNPSFETAQRIISKTTTSAHPTQTPRTNPSNRNVLHLSEHDPNNPFDRETADIRRGMQSGGFLEGKIPFTFSREFERVTGLKLSEGVRILEAELGVTDGREFIEKNWNKVGYVSGRVVPEILNYYKLAKEKGYSWPDELIGFVGGKSMLGYLLEMNASKINYLFNGLNFGYSKEGSDYFSNLIAKLGGMEVVKRAFEDNRIWFIGELGKVTVLSSFEGPDALVEQLAIIISSSENLKRHHAAIDKENQEYQNEHDEFVRDLNRQIDEINRKDYDGHRTDLLGGSLKMNDPVDDINLFDKPKMPEKSGITPVREDVGSKVGDILKSRGLLRYTLNDRRDRIRDELDVYLIDSIAEYVGAGGALSNEGLLSCIERDVDAVSYVKAEERIREWIEKGFDMQVFAGELRGTAKSEVKTVFIPTLWLGNGKPSMDALGRHGVAHVDALLDVWSAGRASRKISLGLQRESHLFLRDFDRPELFEGVPLGLVREESESAGDGIFTLIRQEAQAVQNRVRDGVGDWQGFYAQSDLEGMDVLAAAAKALDESKMPEVFSLNPAAYVVEEGKVKYVRGAYLARFTQLVRTRVNQYADEFGLSDDLREYLLSLNVELRWGNPHASHLNGAEGKIVVYIRDVRFGEEDLKALRAEGFSEESIHKREKAMDWYVSEHEITASIQRALSNFFVSGEDVQGETYFYDFTEGLSMVIGFRRMLESGAFSRLAKKYLSQMWKTAFTQRRFLLDAIDAGYYEQYASVEKMLKYERLKQLPVYVERMRKARIHVSSEDLTPFASADDVKKMADWFGRLKEKVVGDEPLTLFGYYPEALAVRLLVTVVTADLRYGTPDVVTEAEMLLRDMFEFFDKGERNPDGCIEGTLRILPVVCEG